MKKTTRPDHIAVADSEEEEENKKTANLLATYFTTRATREIDYIGAHKEPQIWAALAANVGAFMLGTAMGWSSPAQPQLQLNTSFNYENGQQQQQSRWDMTLDNHQMSWVASLVNLGALFGSLMGGALMNLVGRKGILMMTTLPVGLGWIIVTLAINPGMLYTGRFLCGLAGGICSVAAPSYVSEITTPSMRGPLGTLFSAMLCMGFLVSSLLAWLPWRIFSALFTSVGLVIYGVMFFVPESPYYLAKRGPWKDDARDALQWLRGAEFNIEPEYQQLEARVRIDAEEDSRFSNIVYPWAYKPVLIGAFLLFFQQFSGINAVFFYSVYIFQLAGSNLDRLVSALILNIVLVASVFVSALVVNRIGRRVLFLLSESVVCISIFVLGGYFYVLDQDEETAASIGWLPITSLIIYVAAFSLGVGPLPWLITTEILPPKFRAPGSSIASSVNWTTAFIVTKTFVNMQEAMTTAGAFWFFGVVSFFGLLFGIFILPETKGQSPDEILALFV